MSAGVGRISPNARNRSDLGCVDRRELSFDLFEAPLDPSDERGELRLRERRRLPFLTVAKSADQVSLIAQEPLSGFLWHSSI